MKATLSRGSWSALVSCADSPRLAHESQGKGLAKGPGLLRCAAQIPEVIRADGNLHLRAAPMKSAADSGEQAEAFALVDHLDRGESPDVSAVR